LKDPVVRKLVWIALCIWGRYSCLLPLKNNKVILLLAGGDKTSQNRDIEKANAILNSLED